MTKFEISCHSEKTLRDYRNNLNYFLKIAHKDSESLLMLSQSELDCKGHTYRQIMGLDKLDCGVCHEFLEHPKRYFIKSLWFDFVDFLKQTKN